MATLPFRDLAQRGILRDPSPYQVDLNAWTGGSNMRFSSGKAMRGPIWRSVVDDLIADTAPIVTPSTGVGQPATSVPGASGSARHVIGYKPSTGFDVVYTVNDDRSLYKFANGVLTNVSETGFSGYTDARAFTHAFLGDVLYVNRPDAVPRYLAPGMAAFAPLPNWPSTSRCRVMRAFSDYMVALDVSEVPYGSAAGALPVTTGSMVKWSDLTLAGQVPDSWDSTDSTKSAGENVLEDLTSPLVDGVPLRNSLILYSSDQIWQMAPSGDTFIFSFQRLFGDGGMIAPNCGVDVDGVHYVFGPNDIYRHDGSTKQSICDRRNRDYIFRNLDSKATEVCFAQYIPALSEIVFGYKTGDADAAFHGDRCNKAAVYNILGDTWSFLDLPNVSGMAISNVNSSLTFASAPSSLTAGTIGGSAYDQDSGYAENPLAVSSPVLGAAPTTNRLLAFDFIDKGSLAFPFSPECNSPAYLEHTGISLDAVGGDLVGYKLVRRVYPQISMFSNVPVEILIGGALTPSGTPTYTMTRTYNPVTQYKVDLMKGGRYLALRFTIDQAADFEINGFDLDVVSSGAS